MKDLATDIDNFLEHYGVKGQKWGVVKEKKLIGEKGSSKKEELSEKEIAVLDKLDPQRNQSERLKSMFGPNSNKEPVKETPKEKRHLTDNQKDMIKTGAKFAIAGLAIYGLYKVGQKADPLYKASPQFKEFMKEHGDTSINRQLRGFSKNAIKNLSDEPVNLPIGSIVKRISTEAEHTIRPGGFYAAHKDVDVSRYKAVLPIYWKQWGLNANEGHIVSLKALEEVRAPSPKHTYEVFRNMFDDAVPDNSGRKYRDLIKAQVFDKNVDDDTLARQFFPQAALGWNDEGSHLTSMFFRKIKGEGFNALVDMNDAGSIGDSPLRLLNGKSFKIAGTEKLSKSAIQEAQDAILALAHSIKNLMRKMLVKPKSQTRKDHQ